MVPVQVKRRVVGRRRERVDRPAARGQENLEQRHDRFPQMRKWVDLVQQRSTLDILLTHGVLWTLESRGRHHSRLGDGFDHFVLVRLVRHPRVARLVRLVHQREVRQTRRSLR